MTLQQFKAIQGHRSWCQWKAHVTSYCHCLTLAVSATVLPFSRYSRLKIKQLRFYPTLPCLTPPLWGNLTGAIALVQALQMQRSGRTVCMFKTHKTARVQFGPNNAAVC